MIKFLSARLAQGALVVAGAVVISFLLVNALGNPVDALSHGTQLSASARAALVHQYGFDQPLPARFVDYVTNLLHGDFGTSFRSEASALGMVLEALPRTVLLISATIVVAWAIAAPVAIYSVLRPGSRGNGWIRGSLVVVQGLPDFWFALILILVFSVSLNWLPAIADGSPESIILPTVALALPLVSTFVRLLRSQMLEVMTADFVIAMRVRGLSLKRIVVTHVLPNALPPLIAFMALQIGWLLGSTLIVEAVFGWPGLGNVTITATSNQDLPVIEAAIVVTAIAYVVTNLVADILVMLLDPRIRVAGR